MSDCACDCPNCTPPSPRKELLSYKKFYQDKDSEVFKQLSDLAELSNYFVFKTNFVSRDTKVKLNMAMKDLMHDVIKNTP